MIRTLLTFLLLSAVGGGAYYAGIHQHPAQGGKDPVTHHRVNAPRIEQVRALASLVTLDVPITDLHVSELEGFTGGVKIAVSVRGDVQIVTDLEHARFEEIDLERQDAVLVLPRPRAERPRVDYEKTRIVEIRRSGLWRIAPGQGGEQAVTNRAMAAAQRVLGAAAEDEELIVQACAQAERVMGEFFNALGWDVFVRWDDGGLEGDAAPAATAAAE